MFIVQVFELQHVHGESMMTADGLPVSLSLVIERQILLCVVIYLHIGQDCEQISTCYSIPPFVQLFAGYWHTDMIHFLFYRSHCFLLSNPPRHPSRTWANQFIITPARSTTRRCVIDIQRRDTN